MKSLTSKVGVPDRHYNYSPWHRLLEIVAIAACLSLIGVLSWRLGDAVLLRPELSSFAWIAPAALLGYMAADLVSGVVHWLADRFGSPDTPILGEAFVRPFREHHDRPKEILEHDFVEINGNNSLVMLLLLVPAIVVLPAQLEGAWVGLASFSAAFSSAIFMTNQFHKWAHADDAPAIVRWLHRHGLVLSPSAHDRHHTAPFETDYCITSGWMNPVLERLNVFAGCERLLKRRTSAGKDDRSTEASSVRG
jgi:ubiquitin-conjugating enzyme E2 variant